MGELSRRIEKLLMGDADEVGRGEPDLFTDDVAADGTHTYRMALDSPPGDTRDILRVCGINPNVNEIVGNVTYRSNELADGRVMYAFSFKLRERYDRIDVQEIAHLAQGAHQLVTEFKSGLHIKTADWLVFQAGDLQIGKRSKDGSTEEILERYFESVEKVADELKSGDYAGIQISMPGDLCEGNNSQGGKNVWLTQETISTQTRILRRVMFHTIERLAPLANKVYLDVVNGNHDEAERRWNTIPGDGWGTEAAISVRDALALNKQAFSHVEVRVPDEWTGHMTVPVGSTMVTIVHGHQWGRMENAFKWWTEQAFGKHGPQDSQVLQHGHFHSMSVAREGDRTRICSPTFDAGSDWYREKRGVGQVRGGLMYVLNNGDVRNLTLV